MSICIEPMKLSLKPIEPKPGMRPRVGAARWAERPSAAPAGAGPARAPKAGSPGGRDLADGFRV